MPVAATFPSVSRCLQSDVSFGFDRSREEEGGGGGGGDIIHKVTFMYVFSLLWVSAAYLFLTLRHCSTIVPCFLFALRHC